MIPVFTAWDWALVAVVTVQATLLAYLRHPQAKAFLLTLPIPFSLAALSLGRPLDVTNVAGLLTLLAFTHGVRLLHYRLRVPIVPAIAMAAAGYLLAASGLAAILPRTPTAFWLTAGFTFGLGLLMARLFPHVTEPGHRSPLPIWIKAPLVAGVILLLVVLKHHLQGFMTVFPMVGVIAAYEARHSLGTVCRQIPIIIFSLLPMMILIRLVQPALGMPRALALGWAALLIILTPLTLRQWRRWPPAAAAPPSPP
jgi:hypothetical protein